MCDSFSIIIQDSWISSSSIQRDCERNMELKSPVSGVKLEYVKLKNGIRLRVASAGTFFCFFVRFFRCRRETNR